MLSHRAVTIAIVLALIFVLAPSSAAGNATTNHDPVLLGQFFPVMGPWDVSLYGNLAYLPDSYQGVAIVDVSNPNSPNQVGYILVGKPNEYPQDFQVVGDLGYMLTQNYHARTGTLIVYNMTNPVTPSPLGSVAFTGAGARMAMYETGRTKYAVVAQDTNGIGIYDVTDPVSITAVGSWQISAFVEGVAVKGNYLYVPAWASGVGGLYTLDISNPAQPCVVDSYMGFDTFLGTAVVGDQLFTATGWNGVMLFDIQNPAHPRVVSRAVSAASDTREIVVQGPMVYVANALDGLQVIDFTDPLNPTFSGHYNRPGDFTLGVAVTPDNKIFMADGGPLLILQGGIVDTIFLPATFR